MEAENKQATRKQARLIKIELNDEGDHIVISTGDNTFFDRFTAGFLQIADEAASLPGIYYGIKKKYGCMKGRSIDKIVDKAKVDAGFSEKAIKIIDNIFGKGTLKKYFRQLYEEIPDFLPDAECFADFFKKISPVMETLFNRKIGADERARIESIIKFYHKARNIL